MSAMMHSSLANDSGPVPSIIILRTAEMYHRAGIMSDIQRSAAGMFSIGKMSPENTSVGIISPMPDTSRADICLSTSVEMSSPSASATTMNSTEATESHAMLPRMGTPMTKTASKSTVTMLTTESVKYGAIFESMMCSGFMGEARSTSMVPVSFSRTMATDVIMAQMSISTRPITPGTKLYELFCCGL